MGKFISLRQDFSFKEVFRNETVRRHFISDVLGISILNFNLDSAPEYHKIYHLRDNTGQKFSDIIEIHIVELNKKLSGMDQADEWIRLFRADTNEELDMLKNETENPGILEAIKEVRVMNLSKRLRAIYEFHLREQRDKEALEEQIRIDARAQGLKEGWEEGLGQGLEQGLEQGLKQGLEQGLEQGKLKTLFELIKQDLISIADAAQNANLSEEEFIKQMEKEEI